MFLVLCFLTICIFSPSLGIINGTILGEVIFLNGKEFVLDHSTNFPSMIEILKNGLHLCGGALLKPDVVITAARCISMNGIVPDLQQFYLLAGNQLRNQNTEPWFVQRRSIEKVTIHPDWPKDQSADLALLKPSFDFELDKYVNIIALPGYYIFNPIACYIHGWGFTEKNRYSSLLRFATTDYHPLAECSHLSNSTNNLCLWRTDSGPCFGDFGGPLTEFSYDFYGNNVNTLTGIISFSAGAKVPGDPTKINCLKDKRAIAVKLLPFINWILSM